MDATSMGGISTVDLGIEGIVDAVPTATGSIATVYRASQPTFGRTVAVNVFRPGLEHRQVDPFEREQQVMGTLSGQTSTGGDRRMSTALVAVSSSATPKWDRQERLLAVPAEFR